eukprot:TRINITY_DN7537_c0_g1_i1.p1 TRINITY_DN7537_c0_g1~~TRINITY_DN7537_c0_g1_i1.p1  ORF type:complete len:512 (+),score=82.00 TRINITY_DN7537_c0_g1_i1:49-1584(+)
MRSIHIIVRRVAMFVLPVIIVLELMFYILTSQILKRMYSPAYWALWSIVWALAPLIYLVHFYISTRSISKKIASIETTGTVPMNIEATSGYNDDILETSASVKTPLIRSVRDIAFIPGVPRWTILGRLGIVACVLGIIIHIFAFISALWAHQDITPLFCVICMVEATFCVYCIWTHTEDVRIWRQNSFTKKTKIINGAMKAGLILIVATFVYMNALAGIYCFMTGYNAHVYTAPGIKYDIGGRKMHMNCQGTGSPVVVFIHDWRGQGLDWARVHPKIANQTRSCTIDRTGYGWSDFCEGCGRTSQQESDDMHALLQAANMQNNTFVFVAHHYASFILGIFINQHPEYKIGAAVCIDCVYYGDNPPENEPKRKFWRAYLNLLPSGLCPALASNGWFEELNRYLPLPEQVHQEYMTNELKLDYAQAVIAERQYRNQSKEQAQQAGPFGAMPVRVILSSFSQNNTDFAKISTESVIVSYENAPENMHLTATYAKYVTQQVTQMVLAFSAVSKKK